MDCCPKCKSEDGYFYKNTGSYIEIHGFHMGCYDKGLKVAREGENAFCMNCKGRIEDLDRKKKKTEYWKILDGGKDMGIIPKTQKQKIGSLRNLSGIKLVEATEEDIEKYT